jgi:class 3 adenylate cyclase/ligand-binding sensor domain-containing protein
MQKRIFLIIILIQTCIIPQELVSQELPFRHFTKDNEVNPLPSSAVTAVFQDRTGYVWIAAYGMGLVRYDGHQMEYFGTSEGVSPRIWSIEQDKLGRLWIGSDMGISVTEFPLEKYHPGEKISFTTQIDDLPFNTAALLNRDQLLVDSRGNIWTPTRQEIIRYRYGANDKLLADTISLASLPENQRIVYCFSEQLDGTIRGISHSGHMLLLSPDSLGFDTVPFDISNNNMTTNMLTDRSGNIWGSRKNGELWEMSPEDTTYQPLTRNMTNGLEVRSILETKAGQFLAGSVGGGLIEFSNSLEDPVTYTLKNGMISPVVWDLMQDHEGNIWIATNSGLSRLPGDYKAFGHYTANSTKGAPNMLPESGVICMIAEMEWKSGEKPLLVAGTTGGLSFIKNENARQIVTIEDGLLDNAVLDLSQDRKGRVWIAGRKGITCISNNPRLLRLPGFTAPGKILLFNEPMYIATMSFAPIRQVVNTSLSRSVENPEKVETILFLAASSVLVLADEQFYYLPPELSLKRETLQSISLSRRGFLYVGDREQGLLRSKLPLTIEKLASLGYSKKPMFKNFRSIEEPIFVPNPIKADTFYIASIYFMYWLDSAMWMSTEHGILVLSGDSLKTQAQITAKDGLKANRVAGFLYDPRSELIWASSDLGLFGIDPVSKILRKTVEQKDGLVDGSAWGFPSIQISKSGRIYFGTPKGLSIYDPLLDETDSIPPLVVLRDFQLSENVGERNILEIEYAALSYTYEQGITYQTQLVGFDADWSEETRKTRIRFTNLPAIGFPKKYLFEVKAKDEFGNSLITPFSYPFEIEPPWYLTWWAIALYLVLLVALIYTYIRWRTSALKKRQRELEETVTERTAEIVKQKERSEELLLNILPAEVAEELKLNGKSPARSFDEVTVLFTDIKGFTAISEQLTATELVDEINIFFQAFDEITSKYKIEKIKTIGDAYLAAGGLHLPRITKPNDVVLAALAMQKFVKERREYNQQRGVIGFEMRCGIHTGPVVAGIVGIKKFQYDIWGDTVNTAARMESSGETDKVNISENTFRLIAEDPKFIFFDRGKIEAKNKGAIQMYFVEQAT